MMLKVVHPSLFGSMYAFLIVGNDPIASASKLPANAIIALPLSTHINTPIAATSMHLISNFVKPPVPLNIAITNTIDVPIKSPIVSHIESCAPEEF